jgi:transporter family-2 protein
MDKSVAVGLTAVVGGAIALQAPINSLLGKRIGTFPAAAVSFVVGTLLLIALAFAIGEGVSRFGELKGAPWYYFVGGALGVAYVTTVLVTVRTLGAGGVTAATIAGQLSAAVVVDRLGILGLEKHVVTLPRLAGVALLAAGTFLVVKY